MKNVYKSAAVIRDDAKGFMNGNYGRAIGITMIVGIFTYFANSTLISFDEILIKIFASAGAVSDKAVLGKNIVYYLIMMIVNIMLAVFTIGSSLFYLKIGCKKRGVPSDLFVGFRNDFSKSLRTVFLIEGPILLAQAPGVLSMSYYYDSRSTNSLYIAAVLSIVSIVLTVFFSVSLQMSYFIMNDFPEYSATEVVKACWKKMKGNRWRLVGLLLSFIPYYLLAVLTLGVGMLWVYPLVNEAKTQFYLDLMSPKKVSGNWERTV